MDENKYIAGMLDRTLRYFDQKSVDKVRNTVFAISGLGGVGAITAELLARWGVKKFRLLDMDKYDESNLNRQLFSTSKTIGKYKVDVAEQRIKEINPHAEIEFKISDRVDNENVHRFVKGAGFVIQNADHPSCKLFYIAAKNYKIPLVNGYATITGGRLQAFDYRNSECTSFLETLWNRFKYKNSKPVTEMSRQEIIDFDNQNVHPTAPSLNFVTNMVGCLIVAEAVKFITGRGKPVLYPKYLCFDTFKNKTIIRNTNSIFNSDHWKRLFQVFFR
jgi:molybdopterin/thiamine biosynthesis adenylyltransferase